MNNRDLALALAHISRAYQQITGGMYTSSYEAAIAENMKKAYELLGGTAIEAERLMDVPGYQDYPPETY